MGKVVCRALVVAAVVASLGCFRHRESAGGGEELEPELPRRLREADVALPAGYLIEAVTSGLTFPTGVAFDDAGGIWVVEAGYSYGEVFATPRLLKVTPDGRAEVVAEGRKNGPWTGVAWHQGALYVAEGGELEGGRILRITPDGAETVLVDGLPSVGDHHVNGPAIGPDGRIYFSVGTATNSAIVGQDNSDFGWLKRYPTFHDVPCRDVVATGLNFKSPDQRTPDPKDEVETGPFSPFGTVVQPEQVLAGKVPCSGAILSVAPEGGAPELVAWGFRNPFGLAFAADGRLYATDNGYDERGSRPVYGSADHLWRVEPGRWYGWPDYSGGRTLAGDTFDSRRGPVPRQVIQPVEVPPEPVALFGVHSSSNGLDFSRNPAFGFVGEAFVAQFGDQAPVVGKVLHPVGFKVVRVNPLNGVITDFAVNRGEENGPASELESYGLERPVAARFDPSGTALYVVDFGVMTMTPEQAQPRMATGVLWRITREGAR